MIYPAIVLLVICLFICLINPIVGAINTALYSGPAWRLWARAVKSCWVLCWLE